MSEHVKIGDVSPSIHYRGDGEVCIFAYPFPIFADEDLQVYLDNVKQDSGFTVSGAGDSTGGALTFASAPNDGVTITLCRKVPEERTTDFQEGGAFRAKVINEELDRIVCMVQQIRDDQGRSLALPVTSTSTAKLDVPDPCPGKTLKWNSSGDGLENSEVDPDIIGPALSEALIARDEAQTAATTATNAAGTAATDAANQATSNVQSQLAQYVTDTQTARNETQTAATTAQNAVTVATAEAQKAAEAEARAAQHAANAAGAAILPPVIISPVNAAVGVGLAPTLQAGPFWSLYGKNHKASQWQLSTVSDFSTTLVDTGADTNNLTRYTVSANLDTLTQYFWRVRYQDQDDVWSDWSSNSFTTADIYVAQPSITTPVAYAVDVSETPELTSSAFTVVNSTDTHAASQWRVIDTAGGTTIFDSGEDAVNLEGYKLASGILQVSTAYIVEVRHKGTELGWSDWSAVVGFTTASVFTQDGFAAGFYVFGTTLSYDDKTYLGALYHEDLAFSPDGKYLAGAYGNTTVYVWYTSTWTRVRGIPNANGAAQRALAFSPDSRYLTIVTELSPHLFVYDTSDWSLVTGTPTLDCLYAVDVTWTPDGNYIVVASEGDKRPIFIAVETWVIADIGSTMPTQPRTPDAIAFSPNGEYLARVDYSTPCLKVQKTSDWSFVNGLPAITSNRGQDVTFSPDGQYVAFVHYDSPYLNVVSTSNWSVVSGTPTLPGVGCCCKFSPCGNYLAVGGQEGDGLFIYNTSDWSEVHSDLTMGTTCKAVAWSPLGWSE